MTTKNILNYILILLLSLVGQYAYSQRFSFASDTAYIRELNDYISKSNKTELRNSYNIFVNQWNTDSISSNEKKAIVKISNKLLKKGASSYPYFNSFMQMISSVLKTDNQSINIQNVINIFNLYTDSLKFTNQNINKLFKSVKLIADSGFLYETRILKWKLSSNRFIFNRNDKNQIFIDVNNTDLSCYTKNDSLQIKNTKGRYYLNNNSWNGVGGRADWKRVKLSPDSVFVKLGNYKINMKSLGYTADSVNLTNKYYLNNELLGRFEDAIRYSSKGDDSQYPKFTSYNSVAIHRVVPKLDYVGGFYMVGNKFYGVSNKNIDAKIFIYRNDTLFTKAVSNIFKFNKKGIMSSNTEISIYIKNDSIYHPGLDMNYVVNSEGFILNRSGKGLQENPFLDTYHNLEIDTEELIFRLQDSTMIFKAPPQTVHTASVFASTDYFSQELYDRIAMRDKIHPLFAIYELSGSSRDQIITPSILARYLKKTVTTCRALLIRLANYGFVGYNSRTQEAKAKQKTFNYIFANYRKKDYDEILIHSIPKKSPINASLNLNNMGLTIFGVRPFALSKNSRVAVIPDSNKITITKNLGFSFNGILQAGLAFLEGENLKFNYDSFYVELDTIKSLSLIYKTEEKKELINKKGEKVLGYGHILVKSSVEKITGLLKINKNDNRSGNKIIPKYPIIESHDTSYVYYEIKNKGDTTSTYEKEKFYFKNYPFIIDSLNTIIKKNIDIKGIFNSGGVFPNIEENLTVQRDSSLGFVHDLEKDVGTPLYGGKGNYKNSIFLSNAGLKGSGKVFYLNTSIYSDKFNFFPDSMNVHSKIVEMKKTIKSDSSNVEYPGVTIDSSYIHWEPNKDRMFIKSKKNSFKMYKANAEFVGTLELTPQKLKGKGVIDIAQAQLKSESFTFLSDEFNVDTADFNIKPAELEKKSPVLSYNVKGNIDFIKERGYFESTSNNSFIEFPKNNYLCYINFFHWLMKDKKLLIGTTQNIVKADTLVNDSSVIVSNKIDSISIMPTIQTSFEVAVSDTTYTDDELSKSSRFVSTHANQDSLSFIAKNSYYDIENKIINANGVKFIKIGDAFIFPKNNIIIEPNAKLQKIEEAKIFANSKNKHKFFRASADIISKNEYKGNGYYNYIDKNDNPHLIEFNSVYYNNRNKYTVARSKIVSKDSLLISPEFAYFGNLKLEANKKDIKFDGYAQMRSKCSGSLKQAWFKFKSSLNKDSIVIPIDTIVKNEYNKRLFVGLFYNRDTSGIYTNFINKKRKNRDVAIIRNNGYLRFNERTGNFEISDSTKLNKLELKGNYISLQRTACTVMAEGQLDLGLEFGQVKLSPVGKITENLSNNNIMLEIMLGIDFYFTDAALTFMSNKFSDTNVGKPIKTDEQIYRSNFTELVGLKRMKAYSDELSLTGRFSRLPNEMLHKIFFSYVKFKWNNEKHAYVSEGDIGIGNINKRQINKLVKGKIEILQKNNTKVSEINIYLEIDKNNWFFFTYKNEKMSTVSSFEDFNSIIDDVKEKKRKSPDKQSKFEYDFNKARETSKVMFLEKIKKY